MLGYIKGVVVQKDPDATSVIVRSAGLGLEIYLKQKIWEQIQSAQRYEFWLHLVVREDAMTLYGFDSEVEKRVFRILLTASGLGPRTALNLLSEYDALDLVDRIVQKDCDALCSAVGVGKKLAQKIVLELSTKLEKMQLAIPHRSTRLQTDRQTIATAHPDLGQDLNSALVNLGFAPNQIKLTIERMRGGSDWPQLDFELGLRAALRDLSAHVRPLEGA